MTNHSTTDNQLFNHDESDEQDSSSEYIMTNLPFPVSFDEKLMLRFQEVICQFFLTRVKRSLPESVWQDFVDLFLLYGGKPPQHIGECLSRIVIANQEEIFIQTLKRSCYILINNWCLHRSYQYIKKLIYAFEKLNFEQQVSSKQKQTMLSWLSRFKQSQDYRELTIFAARYTPQEEQNIWSDRYASYLLVSQSLDPSKPYEQREAARILSQQIKEQFKFDLAMYTAYYQANVDPIRKRENPTLLGENALHLIRKILISKGTFSYRNLANIFLQQTKSVKYQEFKSGLVKYLFSSSSKNILISRLRKNLAEYLDTIYVNHDEDCIDDTLVLLTCRKLIDYLTLRKKVKPSQVFLAFLVKKQSLTLAVLLLKIVLICRPITNHLETNLAYLIQYYENEPQADCQSLINFLETVRVALTIYTENVEYSLVSVENNETKTRRIFSQVKLDRSDFWQ